MTRFQGIETIIVLTDGYNVIIITEMTRFQGIETLPANKAWILGFILQK